MANFCIKCGYKVDSTWNFCPVCGTKLPIIDVKTNTNNETCKTKENNIDNTTENKKDNSINKNEQKLKKIVKNHPTLPRKIDRIVFEGRLKEYRLLKSQDEGRPAYCIFDDKAIEAISEARNRILLKQDLYEIKYWSDYRINKYGDEIIEIINHLDQNFIPKY